MRLKGSVTIFTSIILAVLIFFSGIMVDLSRLQTGKKHAQAAVQLSLQSALARYHAPLKEQYGIMATGQSQEELEMLIYELLCKNLAVENRYIPGLIDLYGFDVVDIKVSPCFNMSEHYVLEQQITQFMKYRAPVAVIGDFVEKLKAMNTFMAQSGLLNKKMDFEKQLQKIREEQVYLSLLLSLRINGFTLNQKPNSELLKKIDSVKEYSQRINNSEADGGKLDSALKSIPGLVDTISEVKEQIDTILTSISSKEEERKTYSTEYEDINKSNESIKKDIKKLNDRISDLENAINKENKRANADTQKILDMQKEIDDKKAESENCIKLIEDNNTAMSALSDVITALELYISNMKSDIKDFEDEISDEMALLRSNVNACVDSLTAIKEDFEASLNLVYEIEAVVRKYISYHTEALSLAGEIEKGCKKAAALSESLEAELNRQTEKSDNSFLMRIRTDVRKLVINANPAVIAGIADDISSNLTNLQSIQNAVEGSINEINEQIIKMELLVNSIRDIPKTLNVPPRNTFGKSMETEISRIENHTATQVSGYKKPVYSIEPQINKKEKDEFFRWCNRTFLEENETDNSKDKGQQKKLKKSIEKTDKENKDEPSDYNGDDKALSDKELKEIFSKLPSFKDKNGDYINVKNTEFAPECTDENNLLAANDSNQSDIEDKYGNFLNNNGMFADKIEQVLDFSESLIESMYVNEFIVEAFKNANIDKISAPRIRTGSLSSDTFYEKAEVEYILFGAKREKANTNLARASIFGIRMGLNIVHVYTSPNKATSAMTLATALAGWSGFAVPIVKNLILIGWAAGESWLDVKDINEGKPVAIYKTENTWKLNLKSLFSDISEHFIDETSNWLKKGKDELIDKGDDAIKTAVTDMVSSAVHEAFLPLEQAITELGDELDAVTEPVLQGAQQIGELSDIGALKDWVVNTAKKQYESIKEEGAGWTKQKLEDYKKKITDKIITFIFESNAYKKLVGTLKGGLDNIIDMGSGQLSESIKKLGSSIKDTGVKDQIVGTMLSFDYIDYLRLLLLVVPQKTKLLRTADLMQLNMQKTLDNPDFCLSDYSSYIIIEADISIRYLFLHSLMGEDMSNIKIRWGCGY